MRDLPEAPRVASSSVKRLIESANRTAILTPESKSRTRSPAPMNTTSISSSASATTSSATRLELPAFGELPAGPASVSCSRSPTARVTTPFDPPAESTLTTSASSDSASRSRSRSARTDSNVSNLARAFSLPDSTSSGSESNVLDSASRSRSRTGRTDSTAPLRLRPARELSESESLRSRSPASHAESKSPTLSSESARRLDAMRSDYEAKLSQAYKEKELALKDAAIYRKTAEGPSERDQENALLRYKVKVLQGAAKTGVRTQDPELFKKMVAVDLLFMIDCTSSMTDHIEAAKQQVRSIANDVRMTFFNESDVRVGVIGYRDHDVSADKLVESIDLNATIGEVERFLSDLEAEGGGDTPENVLGGLSAALMASWKHPTRVLVHIADAPSHGSELNDCDDDSFKAMGSEPHGLMYKPLLAGLMKMNIHYCFLRITSITDKMVTKFRQFYESSALQSARTLKKQAPSFESHQLGIEFAQLRNLIVRMVTTSVSRTSIGLTREGMKSPGDESSSRLSALSEGEELELVLTQPNFKDVKCFEEKLEVQAFSPDSLELEDFFSNQEFKVCGTRLTLLKRSEPFAEGSNRHAFYARSQQSERPLVAKSFKIKGKSLEDLNEDMKAQALCKAFAIDFNNLGPPVSIDFVVVTCLVVSSGPLINQVLALEPLLDGEYKKYNSNAAWVSDEASVLNETAQAFSHFTFERSKGRYLVSDIQGCGRVFTDPGIHTQLEAEFPLLDTNLGVAGFKFFFSTHTCNEICKHLKLGSSRSNFQARPPFRATWISSASKSDTYLCCSNKLCNRIVKKAEVKEPEYPGIWCDECVCQLGVKTATKCIELHCGADFSFSSFYHEAVGQAVPRKCVLHRPADRFRSKMDGVKYNTMVQHSGGDKGKPAGGVRVVG